jgi:DNA topoisomerase-3
LKESESLMLTEVRSSRQESEPPKPFTDATLMHAMVHIAAHVSDPHVKAILTEADGLGTPATRPSIIETLFERGYIARRGKAIVSTAIGRALVASLPESATTPDRTAEWEAAMRRIADGTDTMERFLERTAAELVTFIAEAKSRRVLPPPPPAAEAASTPGAHRPRASNRSRRARG